MNVYKKNKGKRRTLQLITLLFSLVFYLMGMICMPMSAGAVGSLEDLGDDVDLTAYTFDELCSKKVVFDGNFENMANGSDIQKGIYYNCKSAQEYYKWLDKAVNSIKHDGKTTGSSDDKKYYRGNAKHTSTEKYTFYPEPNGLTDEWITESEQRYAEAWASYNTLSNQMTRIMARGSGEKLVGDVFGKEFDPTNAVTIAAMNTFTMICNTIFNTVSKALMLLFLVQTGFDVLYLVIPALQPILAPTADSGGAGGAGVHGSGKGHGLPFKFNVVSREAVEANGKGATGSVGGPNGAGGQGFLQSNIFMRYLMARAPLILLAFTYFVLVATNVWTSIISAVTAFITGVFYGL